jgi:cobalamin biosynthesis protein CobD/CbiB
VKELAEWIRQGLSDNKTDKLSFGRMSCAFVLYFLIWWESYLVSHTNSWHDIPANWLILVLAIWTVASAKETAVEGIEAYKAKNTGNVEIAKGVTDGNQGSGSSVEVKVGDSTSVAVGPN